MAKKDENKEQDGRLVSTTAFSVGTDEYDEKGNVTNKATSYQKGEYVDTGDMEEAQVDYYVEQGILVTETEWVGKYKEQPREHEEPSDWPAPAGTMTTAQGAAATQTAQPELRREGDPRTTTTTSGQTPQERTATTRTASGTAAGTDKSGQGPAADARKSTGK
jgi:hypothetical protein